MGVFGALIGPLSNVLSDVLDRFFPNKEEAAKIKHEFMMEALKAQSTIDAAAAEIIKAEAQGESPAQRNWRPHLMYLIMLLMVFNGVVVPLVDVAFNVQLPILQAWNSIPTEMWNLLMIGLGGYVVGRSVEKTVTNWKKD